MERIHPYEGSKKNLEKPDYISSGGTVVGGVFMGPREPMTPNDNRVRAEIINNITQHKS